MPRILLLGGLTLMVTLYFVMGTVYGEDVSSNGQNQEKAENRQNQKKAKPAAPIGKMRGMPAPKAEPNPSAPPSPAPSIGEKIGEKSGVIASDPKGAPRPNLSP